MNGRAVGEALARLELAIDAIALARDDDARLDAIRDARREVAATWSALGASPPRPMTPRRPPMHDEGGPLREPDDVEEHRRPAR